MKTIRNLAIGLAISTLCASQVSAHSGLMAGIDVATPPTTVTKAQLKLPFGMSSKKVRSLLGRDGYKDIVITYIGIIDAKADACRNGVRYRIKVRANGSYAYRNEIGKCKTAIQAADVRGLIRQEGFRRIDIQDDGKIPYLATACRQGDRFDLEVSEYGDVTVKGRVGRCRVKSISPQDLRAALRKDGYNRIKFVANNRRNYIIEACRNGRRLRLNVSNNRRGNINDRQRIGRCAPQIRARDITKLLRQAGLNRIDVIDDRLPRYRAEACNGTNRIRIALNRWGERVDERKIGQCRPPATVASLTEDLRNNARRFKGISVREGRRYPFIATVCDNGQRHELYFSRYGRIEGKKDIGRCDSPRVSAILERLRDRGFRSDDFNVYVEGCRRSGRRVRIQFDEYGNEVGRKRIGRCR